MASVKPTGKVIKKVIKKAVPAKKHDDSDIEIDMSDEVPNNKRIIEEADADDMDRLLLLSRDKTRGTIPALKTLRPSENDESSDTQVDESTDDDTNINVDDDAEEAEDNTDEEAEAEPDIDTEIEEIESEQPSKKRVVKKKSVKAVASKKKPGPGRPRKNPRKDPIPRKGIARAPTSNEDHIQLLYDMPMVLRKIIMFFKLLAAGDIQIIFRPTNIIFYAVDHHKKSKIRVCIDATKINHYYCRSELDIGVKTSELALIFNKVDKEYNSIIIISTTGSTKKNFILSLDHNMKIDESHTIDLIGQYNRMENEYEFIDEEYMIKFDLPGKYFKKTIGDIKSMSNQLSITQEDSESPLSFEYLTNNKKIHSRHTVKDAAKIKLRSNLPDGESFRVDIKVDYIKPIASALISDDITIMVDENKKFMTKAYIDNKTIEIKTLTDIIDMRPSPPEDNTDLD